MSDTDISKRSSGSDELVSRRTSTSGRTLLLTSYAAIVAWWFEWNLGAIWNINDAANIESWQVKIVGVVSLIFLTIAHYFNWHPDKLKLTLETDELTAIISTMEVNKKQRDATTAREQKLIDELNARSERESNPDDPKRIAKLKSNIIKSVSINDRQDPILKGLRTRLNAYKRQALYLNLWIPCGVGLIAIVILICSLAYNWNEPSAEPRPTPQFELFTSDMPDNLDLP